MLSKARRLAAYARREKQGDKPEHFTATVSSTHEI
jgi:hypothetical protein